MGFWSAVWAVVRTLVFGAALLLVVLLVQPIAEPTLRQWPSAGVTVLGLVLLVGLPLLWVAYERMWSEIERWRSGQTVSALLNKRHKVD